MNRKSATAIAAILLIIVIEFLIYQTQELNKPKNIIRCGQVPKIKK